MKLVFPRLYAIMDAVLLTTSGLAFAKLMAEAGVELIQYRDKQASSRSLFHASREFSDFFRSQGMRFIVNDRPDIAALVEAAGVHLGREDVSVNGARAICGPSCWIGVSTHTLEEVEQADKTSADYIAIGPVFPTETKARPEPVVGISFIRRARQLTQKPLVAIGGITLERAAEVLRAGADSVAVARDLLAAPDPVRRARQFMDLAAQIHPAEF